MSTVDYTRYTRIIHCRPCYNVYVINGCVPTNHGKSYAVPIPKGNVSQHVLTAEDFPESLLVLLFQNCSNMQFLLGSSSECAIIGQSA